MDIASGGENLSVSTRTEGTTLKDFTLYFKAFVDSCPELKNKIKKTAKNQQAIGPFCVEKRFVKPAHSKKSVCWTCFEVQFSAAL